jgi:hypothetical protein
MRITNDGKVGIGTTNPGAKLHVNGNLKVTNAGRSGPYTIPYNTWTDITITFPLPFPSGVTPIVLVTPETLSAVEPKVFFIFSVSNTRFTYRVYSGDTITLYIHWMALAP